MFCAFFYFIVELCAVLSASQLLLHPLTHRLNISSTGRKSWPRLCPVKSFKFFAFFSLAYFSIYSVDATFIAHRQQAVVSPQTSPSHWPWSVSSILCRHPHLAVLCLMRATFVAPCKTLQSSSLFKGQLYYLHLWLI